MESFIPTGDENDCYSQDSVNIIIPHQERQTPLYQQPLGRLTLTQINDMREIDGLEQRPVDQTDILAGNQHIVSINRHFFNVLVDKAEPFKDLIIQRDRVESLMPFNEEVFQLKWQDISTEDLVRSVITFDFKTIKLMMLKKTENMRRCFYCSDEMYKNCLLYKVINKDINDNYWIVFLKLMKFIPAIIHKDLNKEIYDICQLEREIAETRSERVEGTTIQFGNTGMRRKRYNLLQNLYDIQVNNINLRHYYVEGFKCVREEKIITPFYFQIVKGNVKDVSGVTIGHEYYVLTNFYNQKDEVLYDSLMYNKEIDTMSLEKMQSTEIGNIRYEVTDAVSIRTGEENRYLMDEIVSQDVPIINKMVGNLEGNTKLARLERRVVEDTKNRIYWTDEKGGKHWKKNPHKGKKEMDSQRIFKYESKKKMTEGTPFMDLHFVITIPYTIVKEEWIIREQKKYMLTESELLTLIYELSLVNGEHLLQLPEIKKDEQGVIVAKPNENMPGLETVEKMQERKQQEQIEEERLRQEQIQYETQQGYRQQQQGIGMYEMNGINNEQYNGYPQMEMEQQYYPMEQVQQGGQQYYTGQPEQMIYPQGMYPQEQQYEQQQQIPIQQEYQEQLFLHPEIGLGPQEGEETFNIGNINP